MAEVVTVSAEAINKLASDINAAKRELLGRLAERGYQLLRSEVPVAFGNLKQGVAPPEVDYDQMSATLTVSARSARTAGGTAEVFGKDGKLKKVVSLRPQPAYNYADVVARGNRQATLRPTHGRAFMIPVSSKPSGEGYMIVGGQIYILRTSRRGQAANPFDQRAADRLTKESVSIADAVLETFV